MAIATRSTKNRKRKADEPVGIEELDQLLKLPTPTLQQYVSAVSAYVMRHASLSAGAKKAAQIRLSNALGRALAAELAPLLPGANTLKIGETKVAGGLRTVNADVCESDELDGLRLAVEIKPINLAVGRAIWNRFGDLRAFAVNVHLKFPFCVVGGVLVVPLSEEVGTKQSQAADQLEQALADDEPQELLASMVTHSSPNPAAPEHGTYKPTKHLIEKAVRRLVRARGRKTEADAPHQLEGIAVIAYDPHTGAIAMDLPSQETGLRWEDFVQDIASAYVARFEN